MTGTKLDDDCRRPKHVSVSSKVLFRVVLREPEYEVVSTPTKWVIAEGNCIGW